MTEFTKLLQNDTHDEIERFYRQLLNNAESKIPLLEKMREEDEYATLDRYMTTVLVSSAATLLAIACNAGVPEDKVDYLFEAVREETDRLRSALPTADDTKVH